MHTFSTKAQEDKYISTDVFKHEGSLCYTPAKHFQSFYLFEPPFCNLKKTLIL